MKYAAFPVSMLCLAVMAHCFASPYSYASTVRTINRDVQISVGIGGNHFFLFGYTSPRALVHLQGAGIEDSTFSEENGYFEFDNRLSPFLSRDACLTSQDQFGRVTPAVCIPPFPLHYDVNVGPVLIAPTLSLDKNNYYMNEQVILTGQTIPNSPVNISFFNDNSTQAPHFLSKAFNPFRDTMYGKVIQSLANGILEAINNGFSPASVDAFSFPSVSTLSDEKGNFSFSLPSSTANTYRLFTEATFQNQPSPKSLTLYLKILPLWMIIIQLLGVLWTFSMAHLVNILIVMQLVSLIIFVARKYWHPWSIYQSKALMMRKKYPLMKQHHRDLAIFTHSDLTRYIDPPHNLITHEN